MLKMGYFKYNRVLTVCSCALNELLFLDDKKVKMKALSVLIPVVNWQNLNTS